MCAHRIVTILALAAALSAGEATPLPAAAQAALQRYEAAVEAAKRQLVLELTKAQDAETRRGNLDGALAIRQTIERLSPPTAGLPAEQGGDRARELIARLPTMTEAEWKALPGDTYALGPNDTVPTRITLADGERWALLPCPTDRWTAETGESFDFRGLTSKPNWAGTTFPAYALCWTAGEGTRSNGLIVSGLGRLTLLANIIKPQPGRGGSIRVKLARLP